MTANTYEAGKKIEDIIKDLSTQASFTGEAMSQFIQLQAACNAQATQIEALERDLDKERDKVGDLNSAMRKIEKLSDERFLEIEQWQARQVELEAREQKINTLEVTTACDERRVEDHQNMVGLIMRNTVMRRNYLGQEIGIVPAEPESRDQYGNITYATAPSVVGVPIEKRESEEET